MKISLHLLAILALIFCACVGLKKEQKNVAVPSPNKEVTILPKTNTQISQVVRTMQQDSKGNLWFGTQNGAFRFDGGSLIRIDEIRSENGKMLQ